MAHLQYMPGDPRLVDQLVCELKSKGIFDQFRKECIADVDTRPAYQNLRQRVETSVSTFLSRQCWKPDLNKNQLREKLRKHILDGNYLEQGVERIVDQVVNPKVASVFIPQVEDLVYNYLGIPRKKAAEPETTETKPEDLLPTDLEAVSPGSVKSNDDKNEEPETEDKDKMEIDKQEVEETKQEIEVNNDVEMSEVTVKSNESESMDKCLIPLPSEEIKLENIPAPMNSPPKSTNAKVELDSIALPNEPNLSTDIPLPEELPKIEKDSYFKPIQLHSEESNSSSDSSLRRNMSPLTPIRNYNNENSCDAQQGFDTDSDAKSDVKTVPSSFRFTIENKEEKSTENSDTNHEVVEKKEQTDLSYQFNNQVNINTYNTPMYDDSSNSNNLHIDYESDINSKTNIELKPEVDNSQDSSKKEKKSDEKKSSHKSSHRSRDSSRHSNSKDKRSDSKHSTSRDSSRHDKKSSRDDKSKSSKDRERSKDRSEKKDNRDSSKHRSSYKSNSKDKDSKSHKSSSSSHRHSSKGSDERKSSSSSSKDKDKTSDKSRDKPKDSKSSSSRESRDKDRKSSSSSKKPEDKDKKKDKKDIDDHYSSSGRGNHSRRSTDRDSNDGSSSSKGSQNHNGSKSLENKKDSKTSSSKSDNTSTSGESPSPSDNKEHIVKDNLKLSQSKPVVRVDNHLETPIATPPRLPFVPDVTLKKPKFAANLQEAKKLMKMRKFLDEEQKRMNQEAALLLEFQANVRPSLSQVYSSIPGPELEFACVSTPSDQNSVPYEVNVPTETPEETIEQKLANLEDSTEENDTIVEMETIPDAAQISEIIGVNINNEDNLVIEEVVLEDMDNVTTVEVINPDDQNSTLEPDDKVENTYDENKPFSELMNEISEYSKATEIKNKTDVEEKTKHDELIPENKEQRIESNTAETTNSANTDNKYFEVTIITEELSESEETDFDPKQQNIDSKTEEQTKDETVIEDDLTQDNESNIKEGTETAIENTASNKESQNTESTPKSNELQYFAEHEKYNAELARHEFYSFLKNYMNSLNTNNKIYLINCDTYEENIVKEVASTMGDFEIINYYKNGHMKLPKTTNVIKDVALSNEVSLPQLKEYEENSPIFSPVKSECSFELSSSDYDSKLDDINKKSRQEVMEIILGSVLETSPAKVDISSEPKEIDTVECEEKNEREILDDTEVERDSLKRSIDEVESSENNNRSVLTPKKMRKVSDSDQISSTTEECEESSNNNRGAGVRSKYLGAARRVGLPRPKRTNVSSSPSSDKSVENYVQNTPVTPNGKIKSTPRTKVQRYDTSDLYKPKLHYLSRRHNVS